MTGKGCSESPETMHYCIGIHSQGISPEASCGDLGCYRSCLYGDLSYFIVDSNGDLSYTNLGKAELV